MTRGSSGGQVNARAGARVGGYLLTAPLGEGAMGQVWRARDEALGRDVALKLLPTTTSEERRRRALRELEAASRVRHPNIVAVHAAGEAPGCLFLAMELVEGEGLDRALQRGPLEPRRAVALALDLARALAALHAAGVVHRDVKPANVLLHADGSPRLADFGVARLAEGEALTRTHQLVGTPVYMAPEQLDGRPADERADVYALGAVLFEALTGQPPADGETLVALSLAKARPTPPSGARAGLPAALDGPVLVALAPRAEDRYPSMRAFADDLERWLAGSAPRARARRTPVVPLLAAAALLSLAAAAAALGVRAARAPAAPPATEAPRARRGADRSTTTEPPWREPDWLRGVKARGDVPSLQAAFAALEAGPDLDPRTRAETLAAVRRLAEAWRPPAAEAERTARLDLLFSIHVLWQAVEPGHLLPPDARRALGQGLGWGLERRTDPAQLTRACRMAIRLAPDYLEAYLVYERTTRDHPDPDRVEVLRAGVAAARAAGNEPVRGLLLMRLIDELDDDPRDEAALLELVRAEYASPYDGPEGAKALLYGAPRASPDEALRFIERAEARAGETPGTLVERHDALKRRYEQAATPDPRDLVEAVRALERALSLFAVTPRPSEADLRGAARRLALERVQLGSHDLAAEALHHALQVGAARGFHDLPALALRRALALEAAGAPEEELRRAFVDLRPRLERWRATTRVRDEYLPHVEALEQELPHAEMAPREVARRLAARGEELFRALDY